MTEVATCIDAGTARAGRALDYRNPLTLRRIDLAMIARGEPGVWVEGDGGTRIVRRRAAKFLDDPDGNAFISPLHLTDRVEQQPPHFVASIIDSAVAGYRTVISGEGFWTIDQIAPSARGESDFIEARKRSFLEQTPLSWDAERGAFIADFAGRPITDIDGPLVVLTSNEPSNYGSFIFRVLPKVPIALKLGKAAKFLVYATHPNFRQLLHLAGLPEDRIILHDPQKIYRSRQIIVISNRNPSACLEGDSLDLFHAIRLGCLGAAGAAPAGAEPSRLYISRSTPDQSQKRPMRNEKALIAALISRGFTIIDPNGLDAAQQVALFGRASLVVGPSGAAMFNAVFCRPGTHLIDIESEPHWIHAHAGLFGSCGLSFGIFQGTPEDKNWSVHHKPWQVNLPALLERIDAIPLEGPPR